MPSNWTKAALGLLVGMALPFAAAAQDFKAPSPFAGWTVLSGGVRLHADKFLGSEAHISHIFDADFYHFHPMVDFSVGNDGALWVGAGVYIEGEMKTDFGSVFLGGSFAPGFYKKGSSIDLGQSFLFRSGIEAGFKTDSGYRVSISYDHRSNANMKKLNPGMETLQLRIGRHFN